MASLQHRLETGLGGRYALERELGQGRMAVVFLAQDLRHDRKVAVKVLRPEIITAVYIFVIEAIRYFIAAVAGFFSLPLT